MTNIPQSHLATDNQILYEAANDLAACNEAIVAGEEARRKAAKIIRDYQAKVGKARVHLEALANASGVHVTTLYRWIAEEKKDNRILTAAKSGDKMAQAAVESYERGERKTLRSAAKHPCVAAKCPVCGDEFPSKNQLRKHAKNHGVTSEGVKDFLDPDHAIRLVKASKASADEYQCKLVEQTVPVLDEARKAVNLLLPFNGDGDEHRFVRLMDSAKECVAREKPLSEAEQHRREQLVEAIRDAARLLTETADKLEAGVFTQEEVAAA